MFYRRKILLTLIEIFGNKISKIELQKYLFLLTRSQKKPAYDFVPYKYGCYSFTIKSDLTLLQKQGFLQINATEIQKINTEIFKNKIEQEDLIKIKQVFKKSKELLTTDNTIHYVYKLAPYFAIKSKIKDRILNAEELKIVEKATPHLKNKSLSTIGYEGISIEAYINKLIKNDIKCLIDVRKNPRSMKFGFAESRLKFICEEVGIKYISIRQLGIDSDKRKKLETQNDYDELFKNYITNNLSITTDSQLYVIELLQKYNRIALTCFEKDVNQCHRKILADFILKKYNPVERVEHI